MGNLVTYMTVHFHSFNRLDRHFRPNHFRQLTFHATKVSLIYFSAFLWASTSLILVILRFNIASIILKFYWLANQNGLFFEILHWRPINFWWFSWNWKFWNFILVIFNFCFFLTLIGFHSNILRPIRTL